ncbi:hypothetical protein PPYR_07034 [Photinus pyralis]|uniref:TIP41-like protein n=1 Tax=Photinus pyralis TaxID=7054 RepID=A0A1Y1LPK6_PHOPY|nr:TIP41-like protein [Photinus pyralis]KAB0799154.1 hypothetical protein PPYR_07034 [Photinus pyralis]
MSSVDNAKATIDNININNLPINSEEYKINDWLFKYKKSHILHSKCSTPDSCKNDSCTPCVFCMFTTGVQLPHLPEMVFPNNVLSLIHGSGLQIEFNALDALKLVSSVELDLKVAYAEAWKESRDPSNLVEKIKPFDWTFSTNYNGSLSGRFSIEPTDERINIERLKEREKILFYEDLMLFEDELHDNGIASCTVKIRVMPSSFFVLLRFFLRVDGVLVRINDTRYYHDFSTPYILREFTCRESPVQQLNVPLQMFGDPNSIGPHLPVCKGTYEKLSWTNSDKKDIATASS